MNATQEYGECSNIYTEMRFGGFIGTQSIQFSNAIESRAFEEPIVDAVGRHFYVPAEAVTVLGVEYRTVPDDSADPGARALTESTDVVMSLELRESTEMVNVTAARASVPLDMQNLWRLRADLLGHGAFELGIDVDALEIVWDEVAVQIDTHAPTPAPTPPPTPANATGAPDEVSTRNAGIFSYLMGSLPGGQDSSVGIGVLASFGALLVCGATYATYVRVQHPSRQKGAQSTNAVNNAAEPVTPKTKTTSPNTATPNTTTPTTATPNAASTHENGRNPLPQFPPDLEDGNEAPLGTKEVDISLLESGVGTDVEDVDVESQVADMLPRSNEQSLTINDGQRNAPPEPSTGSNIIQADAPVQAGPRRGLFSCACQPCGPVSAVPVSASAIPSTTR